MSSIYYLAALGAACCWARCFYGGSSSSERNWRICVYPYSYGCSVHRRLALALICY